MYHWHRAKQFARDLAAFLGFIFSPGIIGAIALVETIYWTSPEWAQSVGFPTKDGDHARAIARCSEFLARTCTAEVVHDGGVPIPPEGLPEWTPIRVEQRFASGLTVVSSLGPHGNFQYIVRNLALPEGETFRMVRGAIIRT
ncbi:hypothetical protein HY635_01315 [Candidatus Uhrbacteria bacterium]|nr:hypothetical protein [Candidatus Uhrbacteria bacterium]